EDLLLDVAKGHARLGGRVRGFDTVDGIEWSESELAQRQLPGFDDRASDLVQAGDRAAKLRAVTEQLERPEIEHRLRVRPDPVGRADPSWRVHVGSAHQEQEAVR